MSLLRSQPLWTHLSAESGTELNCSAHAGAGYERPVRPPHPHPHRHRHTHPHPHPPRPMPCTVKGRLEVSEKAAERLCDRNTEHLWMEDVARVLGDFHRGDCVALGCNGKLLGRGLVGYDTEVIAQLKVCPDSNSRSWGCASNPSVAASGSAPHSGRSRSVRSRRFTRAPIPLHGS